MSYNKPIRRIAIVGTGVIGASWAAEYLARGFDVITTDPGPNAEANLRKYIDEAWKDLTNIGLSKGASRDRLTFTTDMKEALVESGLRSGKRTGASRFQDEVVRANGRCRSDRFNHCVELVRNYAERDAITIQAPGAYSRRTSL